MTAIVLPDIDRSTLEALKARMPTIRLSDIDPPSLERAGRRADRAVDHLLGRSRSSIWPFLAVGIGLLAILGTAAALMTSGHRPSWSRGTNRGSGLPMAGNGIADLEEPMP